MHNLAQQLDRAAVLVFAAIIPEKEGREPIFPKEREEEINGALSPKVKREKYYAWKLLEYALEKSFGKRMEEVKFEKTPSGKWTCDACEFSLSHSHNLAVVSVAKTPVGVDVEGVKMPKADIAKEILSGVEYDAFLAMQEEERVFYLISAWTRKESLFKQKGVKRLAREEFRSLSGAVFERTIFALGEAYALSVATSSPEKVQLYENVIL